jgi:hypothetical protein
MNEDLDYIQTLAKINDDGMLTLVQIQDVTEVLKFCKHMRDNQIGSNKKSGQRMKDYHMAYRCPTILIEKLINDKVLTIDYARDPGQKAKLALIIQRDYPGFLCTNRNLGKLFKGKG